MLSKKATYALHALIALAETPREDALMIGEIAERKRLPRKFLEQILVDLKHHGLVASRRGKYGGYTLLKDVDDIRLGEVIRIIDGPLAPLPCLSRMAYRRCDECANESRCTLRRALGRAHEATTAVLDGTTLADLLPQPHADAADDAGRQSA